MPYHFQSHFCWNFMVIYYEIWSISEWILLKVQPRQQIIWMKTFTTSLPIRPIIFVDFNDGFRFQLVTSSVTLLMFWADIANDTYWDSLIILLLHLSCIQISKHFLFRSNISPFYWTNRRSRSSRGEFKRP